MQDLLEPEKRIEDILESQVSYKKCGFHRVGMARESLVTDARRAYTRRAGIITSCDGRRVRVNCSSRSRRRTSSATSPCVIRSSVYNSAVWHVAMMRAFRVLRVVTSGMWCACAAVVVSWV